MSYLLNTVSDKDGVIYIGADTQYPYIYMNHRKRHGRFVSSLISQMLRDFLHIALLSDLHLQNFDLQTLSSVEFKCDCEGEFRTSTRSLHNRNRLREHSSRDHICLKKTVALLKPIVIKLLSHHSKRIVSLFEKKEKTESKSNTDSGSGSWYNSLHAGEYDDWENDTYGGIYDQLRSKIDNLTRRMVADLIICKRRENPIFLKFESIEGYYPVRIICELSKTAIVKVSKDDEFYVLKIGSGNKDGVKSIKKELEILTNLESPPSYLPTLLDSFIIPSIFTDISHICLVFEMFGLDLFEKILKRDLYARRGLKVDSIRYITYQLVESLRYLHQRRLIHNDIKLENVLFKNARIDHNYVLNEIDIDITNDLDIVLIDFGLSVEEEKTHSAIQGTIPYLSPEEIEGQTGSFETDIWSLGVVILELTTGIGVFGTDVLENMVIIEAITNHAFDTINSGIEHIENYEVVRNEFFEEDRYDERGVKYDLHYIPYSANDEYLADFLSGCLNPNRKERYTIDQLYYHPFLSKYTEQDREISID